MTLAGLVLPWWSRWALLAAVVVAFGGTCWVKGATHGAAKVQASWDKAKDAEERAYLDALQKAQAKGDALAKRLQDQLATTTQAREEKQHEIIRYITGKPCLSAPALRVLNAPAPGPSVPQASPGAAAKDASPPAADQGNAASDTDVAQWIGLAQDQYDECAGRLNTLIEYEQ